MSKSKMKQGSKSKSSRPVPKSAREYLQFIGSIGGATSRRDLAANQARRMVAIREAKRALIKQGRPELTWDRWPLKIEAKYTDIRKRAPKIGYEYLPGKIKRGSRS
jgi:hypothetical protein